MPSRRNTTLKVIKGAKAGPATPRRRLVNRAVPASAEPIERMLERLDREPVEDPIEAGDLTVVGDPAEVEDLPEPEPAEPDAAEPDAADGPAGTAPSRRRRALVALLVVLLAAALAGAGVQGHRWYVDRATDQARREAVAAARQAAVNFVSVSAASVDRDLSRITAGATGDFKDEFTRGQAQVRTAVVENKVQSQGTVLRAGLVSGDRRRAVVLVAVDATVRNVKAPDGRPSHYRIQLDLVRDRDSGDWLVTRLQFVG
ncbi:Mce-associated membrane protein [Micromonospora chaiyaphumensis]|uniref:Mce-associated membrane protein n=1 Tax=Micromonospora chaiyaphumensis TaxID=307119 RepID=A0A1C4U4S9_9ACTN|nr:Mce-associated membrane protein [Micromonospora chaiyaphumensis]